MTRSSVSPMRLAAGLLAAATALTLAAPAGASERVVIKGGGWGHGIGMSQYGAYGLAKRGKRAGAILRHYYRGVDLSRRRMPKVRVGLLQYDSSIGMSSNGGRVEFKVVGTKGRIARGTASDSWSVQPSSTGRIRLYKNGNQVVRDGRRAFGGPSKPLLAIYENFGSSVSVAEKGTAYRYGRLEVGSYASSSCGAGYCLRLVLKVSMQKYLYGLGEVPSSWPGAVLQAQAIAGRTYAYRKIKAYGQHTSPCNCAVVDSVYDQAYIGDAKRTGSGEYWDDWKRAVDRTDRKVILFNGEPIQALYSSSSGGHTENNENVWGGSPLPYLRGVKDPTDGVAVNPNHSWRLEMSRSELASKLNAAYGIGSLKAIKLVRPFGVSGRVTVVKPGVGGGVKIVGTNRTVRVSGWSLRSALGLKDTLFRISFFYPVWYRMQAKYDDLNGAPGRALGEAYRVPKGANRGLGRAQDFQHGRMTWRRRTGKTVWQWGKVLRAYDRLGARTHGCGCRPRTSGGLVGTAERPTRTARSFGRGPTALPRSSVSGRRCTRLKDGSADTSAFRCRRTRRPLTCRMEAFVRSSRAAGCMGRRRIRRSMPCGADRGPLRRDQRSQVGVRIPHEPRPHPGRRYEGELQSRHDHLSGWRRSHRRLRVTATKSA